MSDRISALYSENKPELSWLIKSGAVCDEHDMSYHHRSDRV